MKKAFLFALAAFCVSAVQAVTFSWTGTRGTDLNQPFSFENADYFNVSVSLAGLCSAWSGNTGDTILQITDSNGNNVIHVTVQKGSGWHFKINNGTAYKSDDYTQDITLSFSAEKTNGIWSDLTWSWESTWRSDKTLTEGANATKSFSGQIAGANISDIDVITITEKLNGNATVTISDVPEPTALALLALGVAGLALKRKVA